MTNYRSNANLGKSNVAAGKSHGSSSKSGSPSRDVSPERLHQKTGLNNSFGGYTKVNKPDGTFRMRKSGK